MGSRRASRRRSRAQRGDSALVRTRSNDKRSRLPSPALLAAWRGPRCVAGCRCARPRGRPIVGRRPGRRRGVRAIGCAAAPGPTALRGPHRRWPTERYRRVCSGAESRSDFQGRWETKGNLVLVFLVFHRPSFPQPSSCCSARRVRGTEAMPAGRGGLDGSALAVAPDQTRDLRQAAPAGCARRGRRSACARRR